MHAGDFTVYGRRKEVSAFNDWLGEQTHIPHKIVVAGNHEIEPTILRDLLPNCTLLEDKAIKVLGLEIYGTKWRSDWTKIPEGLHILLTHCPPSTSDWRNPLCVLMYPLRSRAGRHHSQRGIGWL